MAEILSGSLDLSKIDQSKIVKGEKGQLFYPISVSINDTEDKYKNIASITTNQTKEERAAKTPKVFLGNLKSVWKSESTPKQETANEQVGNSENLPDFLK